MKMAGARKWWALGAIQLAVLAVGLDITVLSVALPTLATALQGSESELQWFSSGYTLVLAAAMLPIGLLGDRYGRKKVMLTALALFGAGSLACAYAPSAGAFLAARLVLGLAGAGVIVMAVSALVVLFDERQRPRAVAIWAGANFLAMPIGPLLGGWMLSHFWWGWVFLINVPVVLVGLVAALALVPESRSARRPGLDPLGMAAASGGLAVVTYGLIEAGQNGWGDAAALTAMIGGLGVLVAFFAWEHRLARLPGGEPLIDLGLFRSASFTWSVILVTIGMVALVGVIFTVPQYFQGVLGTDAMGSGLRLLPLVAGLIGGVAPGNGLVRLMGVKLTVALGFAVLSGGLIAGATTGVSSGTGFAAAWLAVAGAGMGLVFMPAAAAALSEVPAERSGMGAAMLQALRNVGAPLGAAVLGSVVNSAYLAHLHLPPQPAPLADAARNSIFGAVSVAGKIGSPSLLASARAAFVQGMAEALAVSAGIAVAGIVLALVFLPGRIPAGAGKLRRAERGMPHASGSRATGTGVA